MTILTFFTIWQFDNRKVRTFKNNEKLYWGLEDPEEERKTDCQGLPDRSGG